MELSKGIAAKLPKLNSLKRTIQTVRVAVGREFPFPFPQDFCGNPHMDRGGPELIHDGHFLRRLFVILPNKRGVITKTNIWF